MHIYSQWKEISGHKKLSTFFPFFSTLLFFFRLRDEPANYAPHYHQWRWWRRWCWHEIYLVRLQSISAVIFHFLGYQYFSLISDSVYINYVNAYPSSLHFCWMLVRYLLCDSIAFRSDENLWVKCLNCVQTFCSQKKSNLPSDRCISILRRVRVCSTRKVNKCFISFIYYTRRWYGPSHTQDIPDLYDNIHMGTKKNVECFSFSRIDGCFFFFVFIHSSDYLHNLIALDTNFRIDLIISQYFHSTNHLNCETWWLTAQLCHFFRNRLHDTKMVHWWWLLVFLFLYCISYKLNGLNQFSLLMTSKLLASSSLHSLRMLLCCIIFPHFSFAVAPMNLPTL